MPSNQFLLHCVVALLISVSLAMSVRSDESSGQSGVSTAAEDGQQEKRWYADFDKAKRAANLSGRPIMIVFR